MSDSNVSMEPGKTEPVEKSIFLLSGGFLAGFVLLSLINIDLISYLVNASQAFSVKYFGALWQIIVLGTFLISLYFGLSKYGNIRLGKLDKPEMSTFKWGAIIITTILAGGGVFFSAAEPMYHFLTVPPTFSGITAGTPEAVSPAFAQSYLHWGFLAWSIIGTLGAVIIMYCHYEKGQPLKPRTLLYPLLGELATKGPLGVLVDVVSIIAVAAGTVGPIGFLALQLSYSLQALVGVPDVYSTQIAVVLVITAIYTIAASTGLSKGIDFLSKFTIYLAIVLLLIIMTLGPGQFIMNSLFSGFGLYMQDFFRLSLYRDSGPWLGWWTFFYWSWFLGYAPMSAVLVARISRGRTIRELMLLVAVIAPVATNIWFTVLGGAGINFELLNPGSISEALNTSGLPAALLAIVNQMPLSKLVIPLTLVLVVLFLVTTGAGMTFSLAIAVTGKENPPIWARVFWGVVMGAMAGLLIKIGDGGIKALQTFIIVSAVPLSFVYIPTLWTGPKCILEMAKLYGTEEKGKMPLVGTPCEE